jgi:dCMP deaminase
MMPNRPDWDSYFMEIADIVSKRSTCLRRSVGALIVKDKRILATGYNGAPTGLKHCMEVGCLREQMKIAPGERHELCRGLHAEQNAIIQAAYHGVTINGAHLYCTHLPCSICIKMLINAGIEKVFYLEGYPDDLSMKMIDESSIIIGKVNFQRAERGGTPEKTLRSVPSRNSGVKRKDKKGPRKV